MGEKTTEKGSDSIPAQIRSRLNILALLSGMFFISMLALGGLYIQSEAQQPITFQSYEPLIISYLIGISVGHYLAKASEPKQDAMRSAYLGAFLMLSFYWVYINSSMMLSSILLTSAVTLVLGHFSGLIRNHMAVKELVDILAKGLSPFGLILIGVLQYALPTLPAEVTMDGETFSLGPLYGFFTIVIILFGVFILYAWIATKLENSNTRARNTR